MGDFDPEAFLRELQALCAKHRVVLSGEFLVSPEWSPVDKYGAPTERVALDGVDGEHVYRKD